MKRKTSLDNKSLGRSSFRIQTEKKKSKENESISMFTINKQVVPPDGVGGLARLLYKIQASIIGVSNAIRNHLLVGIPGYSKSQIEEELVTTCEKIFLNSMSTSGATCILASERCENEYYVHEKLRGEYVVTFVALDGDAQNLTTSRGSIFTIYRRSRAGKLMDLELLQEGKSIVACGYALYGPVTCLVLALAHGLGAHQFYLNPDTNEFIRSPKILQIPKSGVYYSINEGLSLRWLKSISNYMKQKKDYKTNHKRYISIYSGSLIADTHKILKHGGILIKPAYTDRPFGKFLLQFHVNPIAFIIMEAGGLASNGKNDILTLEVIKIRQSCPLYCGSVEDVSELTRFTSNMKVFTRA